MLTGNEWMFGGLSAAGELFQVTAAAGLNALITAVVVRDIIHYI